MDSLSYVVPYEAALITAVHNYKLVVVADCAKCIVPIAQVVQASGNQLDCIFYRHYGDLETIEWSDAWVDIPLVIAAQTLGKFRAFSQKFDLLRQLDVCINLPLNSEQNASALRILSSLGIVTCAMFTLETDWDTAIDLMTYAVLGKSPHAPIQPFNYIAENYRADHYSGWQEMLFNDPKYYLHVDTSGRVAATAADLTAGNFLYTDFNSNPNVSDLDSYNTALFAWQQHFLANDECARCSGWKSCRGGVANIVTNKTQCSALFTELFELAAQYQQQRNNNQLQPSRTKRWSQL